MRLAQGSPILLCCAAAATVLLSASQAAAAKILLLEEGSLPTLQAALESTKSSAEDTVVVLPPGDWDYKDNHLIVQGVHGVTVLGSGPEQTRLFRSQCVGGAMLQFEESSNVRVSGIHFDGCDDPDSQANAIGLHLIDVADFRVDNCWFRQHGQAGVRTNREKSDCYGVVDHCKFEKIYKQGLDLGYGVAVLGIGKIEHVPFGSAKATFIEDSTFEDTRHASASNGGGRYVFRHNDVSKNVVSHSVDAHGHEGSSTVGTEWIEVYKNRIHNPVATEAAVRIRGGKGLVWGNEINGFQNAVSLWEKTDQETGPVHLWGNDLGPGVQSVGDIEGSVSYSKEKPDNYTPYTYPHPFVTAVVAQAGPDQRIMLSENAASLYLDSSASSVDTGNIVAQRWYEGQTLLSQCARDVLSLSKGTHVLTLEVERSDKKLSHDVVIARAVAQGPISSSETWNKLWFVPLVGSGTLEVEATPAASSVNAYVAFAGRRKVAGHEDNAILVRFNKSGKIDVYDGDKGYRADAERSYEKGVAYRLKIAVDVAKKVFHVSVNDAPLASGYSFRAEAQSLSQMVLWHDTGELSATLPTVAGDVAQPDPECQGNDGSAGTLDSGGAGGSSGASDAATEKAFPQETAGSAGSQSSEAGASGHSGSGNQHSPKADAVPGDSGDSSAGCSCKACDRPSGGLLGWGLALLGLFGIGLRTGKPS